MKMTWKFNFDSENNFLRITTKGFYNPADHKQMMLETLKLPYWIPGLPVLLDNRKLSYAAATMQDLQKSSDEMTRSDRLIGDSKIAFLAGSLADLQVIRQFELLTEEDVEAWMQVFLDESQALRWLKKYGGNLASDTDLLNENRRD